ncbi:DUF1552 domain-containing protein [Halioxenophilus aromaticivorans]|uniref:DUF1552 domain-containing protein n=1 Tax=Halioxenophilus aromaticivorans TaxID=1306992 RepID=A0AAV3U5G0_9ALTE
MTDSTQINRRSLLRGLGVAITLPVMESLLPKPALAYENRPKRMSVFYTPNGMRMQRFTPQETGRDYTLSPILQPLAKHRDKFTVISGLAHYNASALGDGPGSHGRSCAAYLTGAHPKRTEGSDLYCGISMDQLLANHIGKDSLFPSLELGIEPPSLLGSCDVGYSCTYTNTLSWRSPTSPLPVSVKPQDVFERLFGDASAVDEAARAAQTARKASILDFVLADSQRLNPKLGANDRRKLEEYLDSIRSVEKRIQKASQQSLDINADVITLPAGLPDSFEEHVRLMTELQILALQSDMTRVVTLMAGRELSNRAYPEIGVPDAHHSLSHHGYDPEKIDKLVKINQYHMQQFGYLLERLATTPDGEGSLLDSTLVLGGASLGESNEHDNMDLPVLVAGGGVPGNRHIAMPKHTPMCNLMLAMMQQLGVPAESFGDSTQPLTQLMG